MNLMIRASRGLRVSAFACCCLIATSVTVGIQAQASPASSGTASGVTAQGQVPAEIPQSLEAFGVAHMPDIFGGVGLDDKGSVLHVYLTTLSTGNESLFVDQSKGYPTVFSLTHANEATLDALHNRVNSDWQTLIQSGTDVNQFWPDVRTGIEDIGVQNVTDSDITALDARYGEGNISVFNVTDAQVAAFHFQSRINDFAPWYASDVIWGTVPGGKAGCTLGYGIDLNSSHAVRMLTAGHCEFNIGSTVYNAQQNNFTNTTNPVGTAVQNEFSNNRDVELINAASGYEVWRGPVGPSTYPAPVVGSLNNITGAQVCADGSYGGEICQMTVDQANVCLHLGGAYLCNMVTATPGGAHTVDGDSGGPWFQLSGGNLYAVGIHTGWDGVHEYYSGINAILGYLNASLCSTSNPYC